MESNEVFNVKCVRKQLTNSYWNGWVRKSIYQGSWKEAVHRSALALKLLIYEPTGRCLSFTMVYGNINTLLHRCCSCQSYIQFARVYRRHEELVSLVSSLYVHLTDPHHQGLPVCHS